MTLGAGDVLMLGCDVGRPLANAGDSIEISAPGLGSLQQHPGGASIMKRARVVHESVTHDATERDGQLLLDDGRLLPFDAVTWLPPLSPTPQPRTILALGLNYADHAKELEFKAPEEPLVFLKGESALTGHRRFTRRPERRAVHALRVRADGCHRTRPRNVQARSTPTTSSPATPWPTTTRFATTWRTGTGPTCA